jgi:hypothetical protein
MNQPQDRAPGHDDTAAFKAFYGEGRPEEAGPRSALYRLLIGWWRDRD